MENHIKFNLYYQKVL